MCILVSEGSNKRQRGRQGWGEIQIILEIGGLGTVFTKLILKGVLLMGVMSVLWLRYSASSFGEQRSQQWKLHLFSRHTPRPISQVLLYAHL